jgi:hypothetical protein
MTSVRVSRRRLGGVGLVFECLLCLLRGSPVVFEAAR